MDYAPVISFEMSTSQRTPNTGQNKSKLIDFVMRIELINSSNLMARFSFFFEKFENLYLHVFIFGNMFPENHCLVFSDFFTCCLRLIRWLLVTGATPASPAPGRCLQVLHLVLVCSSWSVPLPCDPYHPWPPWHHSQPSGSGWRLWGTDGETENKMAEYVNRQNADEVKTNVLSEQRKMANYTWLKSGDIDLQI